MAIANITGNILTDSGISTSSLLTGSGTTNYFPKFTAASTIGNSTLQEIANGLIQLGNSSIGTSEIDIIGNSAAILYLYDGFASNYIQGFYTDFTIYNQIGATSTNLMNYNYSSKALTFQTNGNNTRLAITSTGAVGIGTTSPQAKLQVGAFDNANALVIAADPSSPSSLYFGDGTGAALYRGFVEYAHESDTMSIGTSATTKMTITSGGNVLIGTTSGNEKFVVYNTTNDYSSAKFTNNCSSGQSYGLLVQAGTNSSDAALRVQSQSGSSYFTIRGDGNVGIGTSSPSFKLDVQNAGTFGIRLNNTGDGGDTYIQYNNTSSAFSIGINSAGWFSYTSQAKTYDWWTSNAIKMSLNSSGNLSITGALSKGSGSFKIDHPLESMSETHNLVHSFVEAPQADLYYRGKLNLINGKGQANIDEVATMTEGTFEALCREVQCFTTNETGWDLVKGKVMGNIIYIESQNKESKDEISWLVIGERKDKHMMDTEWTDYNGKVIVEPLKELKNK
jgi:hypothetical protein